MAQALGVLGRQAFSQGHPAQVCTGTVGGHLAGLRPPQPLSMQAVAQARAVVLARQIRTGNLTPLNSRTQQKDSAMAGVVVT